MTLSKLLRITFAFFLILFPVTKAEAKNMNSSQDKLFFVASKNGIFSGRINPDTGETHSLQLAAEVMNPGFLAIHPNRKFLFAVNTAKISGKNIGVTSAFSINPKSGNLTLLNEQPTQGTGPTHLVVDNKGQNVLVANYGSGSVAVFPIQKNGSLDSASSFVQHAGSSVHPKRQTGPHAHSITTDPKDRFVVSCDLGLDQVLIYKFNSEKGSLEAHDPTHVSLTPGAGPRHHAFHPSGKFLYVINELDSTMTGFRYDSKRGSLTENQTVSTVPQNFSGTNYPSEVAVHPSGKFLYGSNRGHDSIVVYNVDESNGQLSVVEYEPTGGKFPRHFEIDPSGKYIYAANQNSDNIVAFQIDKRTGVLTPTGHVLPIEQPQCIKFVP